MEFRLTYSGELLAHTTDRRLPERSLHVHKIRRHFHQQLKELWQVHPVLTKSSNAYTGAPPGNEQRFTREGFTFVPIATRELGLICKLDILLLRSGDPGDVLADIDNRLKTLFDALRMPSGPDELGRNTSQGIQSPGPGEDPFYVLLEDDSLITHVAITSDRILEPVDELPAANAVRLVLSVTIRPYDVHMDNLSFA
jgi:hypothetical protein